MTRTLMTGLLLLVLACVAVGGSSLIDGLRRALHRMWNDEAAETVRKSRIGWW